MTTRRAFAWACCLASVCLAASSVRLAEKETARANQAEAIAKALEAKHSETTCEPVYGAYWIAYECPPIIGGTLPDSVKPLVCRTRIERFRSSDLAKTRERLPGAGTAVMVLDERGAREKPLSVVWEPVIR